MKEPMDWTKEEAEIYNKGWKEGSENARSYYATAQEQFFQALLEKRVFLNRHTETGDFRVDVYPLEQGDTK